MATGKGQFLNADLDIFWDDLPESEEGTTESADDASMDIFWWALDEEETSTPDAEEEAVVEETTEEPTEEEETTEGNEEELDVDLEKLFEEIENAASDDSETLQLVDELRKEVADLSTQNAILQKKNDSLNEKLMEQVWTDSNMWMYKWVIDKLEENPKLMVLVKNFGNTDDKIKQRLTWIVSDIIFDLTWQDISEMLDQAQSTKITSLMGAWWKEAPAPVKESKEKEEPMDYEESISSLF